MRVKPGFVQMPTARKWFLFLVGLTCTCSNNSVFALSKIKEKELQVLTLQEGKYTTSRRGPPVPQLKCLSGCSQTPKTVQCYNRGWDGEANNWECKASLPNDVRFGEIDVNCEGYDYPDDPYITQGSCSLNYHLLRSSNRQGGSYGFSSFFSGQTGKASPSYAKKDGGGVYNFLFWLIIIVVFVWFMKSSWRSNGNGVEGIDPHTDSGRGFPGGDSGSRGFYGSGGPPGGPGFRPDFYGPGGSCGGGNAPPPYADGSNGPGFWSGAMAGGLLGYLLGNQGTGFRDAYGYGGSYDGLYRRERYRQEDDSDWGFFGSSSNSPSGGTHESSAYSRTSRR